MPPHSVYNHDENSFSDDEERTNNDDTVFHTKVQPKLVRTRSPSFQTISTSSSSIVQQQGQYQFIPKASSAMSIRSKLMNRLGISSKIDELNRLPQSTKDPTSVVTNGNLCSFDESLKADYGKTDINIITNKINTPVSGINSYNNKKKNIVCFNTSVKVYPIPKHNAYSKRIKYELWTHPMELQQNVARNSLEFASENWDWKQVANDNDMIIYNGERIHPIHFIMQQKNDEE